MMSIIKNPIVLGVLAGGLTYIYLWYVNKNKENKKNSKKKEISLITPLIVALAVCIVAYLYFSPSGSSSVETVNPVVSSTNTKFRLPVEKPEVVSPADSAASFHLISKGVNIPNNIPEIFIETY